MAPWLTWMLPGDRFVLSAGLLTLLVVAVGVHVINTRPLWGGPVLRVIAWVMLANSASHLALSIATLSYMPGLVTALLVVLPVFTSVAWRLRGRG